jgi:preprotein translocase subunit SecB
MTNSTKEVDQRQQRLSDDVAARMSFEDIRLSKIAAELKNAAPQLPLNTTVSLVSRVFERPPRLAVYHLSYVFAATDQNQKPAWETSFTLSLSFRLNDRKISDEALREFGLRGVVEIAHPYARELVHHITARMRVPAFILEVLPPLPRPSR